MPWDGTELWTARIEKDGSLADAERVAGGEEESIFQPEWSPDGVLHFISDRTGWWNLYCFHNGRVEALLEMAAEFGVPQWLLGPSTYAFESKDRIICTYTKLGLGCLGSLDTQAGKLDPVETPYTSIGCLRASSGRIVCLGGSAREPTSVVQIDLESCKAKVLRSSNQINISPTYLSAPQPIEFPTEGGLTAHAFFYSPKNADCEGPPGEQPPLLVTSHGGPTAATSSAFNPMIQFWTSRGIAVLDVNYGGSTGYGRAYRQRLDGQWGIVDVDDCVNGAHYLVERGEVDANRLAIRGGSAGGYTTLSALTFRDVFRAGASYYGVSDLEALAKETHKFESRYLDRLIGPYPQKAKLFRDRSPIYFVNRLSCPVIFFQGLEDKIVPANQAETMVEALSKKGVPVAYVPFEGEQHGFRRSENIKRALDGELYFYSRVFGFELSDPVEAVPIQNL
jgi:dipeptidyl aminopeptidase/acylaminoacyl peptidase